MDILDFSADNQANISDLGESFNDSLEELKDKLQDVETEVDERLSYLERRLIDFLDAYEDIIIPRKYTNYEECEDELPFTN